jgi:hypothetical protein
VPVIHGGSHASDTPDDRPNLRASEFNSENTAGEITWESRAGSSAPLLAARGGLQAIDEQLR